MIRQEVRIHSAIRSRALSNSLRQSTNGDTALRRRDISLSRPFPKATGAQHASSAASSPNSRRYSAKLSKRSTLPECTSSVSDGAPSAKIYVMLSELYVQILNLRMFDGRMHRDRRAVDEVDGLDEQTIYPKSMLLGDEQITARCIRAESALRHTHGQNAIGMLAIGRSSVHTATNPSDWLCLTAQSREQIANPKVLDFARSSADRRPGLGARQRARQ